MGYEILEYENIQVFYTPELDGGGTTFGQAYIPFVRDHFGPVGRVFEWCAGPAYIGFSLLAHGLCEYLDLADMNPRAVEAARATVQHNRLQDRVSVHLSDSIDKLPEDCRWDLVVGNPPHINHHEPIPERDQPPLIYLDTGWAVHRRFYATVGQRLRPNGSIVILENSKYSQLDDFVPMIEQGGLCVVGVHDAGRGLYWLWSRLA